MAISFLRACEWQVRCLSLSFGSRELACWWAWSLHSNSPIIKSGISSISHASQVRSQQIVCLFPPFRGTPRISRRPSRRAAVKFLVKLKTHLIINRNKLKCKENRSSSSMLTKFHFQRSIFIFFFEFLGFHKIFSFFFIFFEMGYGMGFWEGNPI